MNRLVLISCLIGIAVSGCSWIPRAGPSTSDVLEQGRAAGEMLFDVVEVDDRVVKTLIAQPKERFALHFKKDEQPANVKIAIGDTISVLIWESAAGGLFSEAPAVAAPTGGRSGIEPLARESQRPTDEFGGPRAPTQAGQPQEQQRPNARNPSREPSSIEAAAAASGRRAAIIPDQQVGADGAISVPYAGRVPVAGRLPAEVQQAIETRLAEKALGPQPLVIVKKSAANAVTVLLRGSEQVSSIGFDGASIENLISNLSNPDQVPTAAAAAARVPLSPGGDKLLQVIAAGGVEGSGP